MKKPLSKEFIFLISFFSGAAIIALGVVIGIALFGSSDSDSTPSDASKPSVIYHNPDPTTENSTDFDFKSSTIAPTTTPTPAHNSIVIDDDLQYDLNIFLSNFSEVNLSSFSGAPTTNELIKFGFMHNHLNKDTFESNDTYSNYSYFHHKLNYKYVIQAVEKYFSASLSKNDFSNYPNYSDGYIYCDCTGGWLSNGFSIANQIESLGNGLYSVQFYVYDDSMGFDRNTIYYNSPSDIANTSYSQCGSGSAVISIGDFSKRDTYTLKSYSVSRY